MAKEKKRKDEVVRIVPGKEGLVFVYELLPAFEKSRQLLGRILVDQEGYWIYGGNDWKLMSRNILQTFSKAF